MADHRRVLGLCALFLLAGCAVTRTSPSEAPVREAVPLMTLAAPTRAPIATTVPAEQVMDPGLRWRECAVNGFDWRKGEACLGYSLSSLRGGGAAGTRTEDGELVLRVGGDVYETRTLGRDGPLPRASLHKNGRRLRTFFDGAPVHSPNISLRLIDGKVAWEFSGERVQTIVYDGKDLRAQQGLDAAYRPYELDGKPILIGQKDDAYFVVYDGKQVGPEFDRIVIAYCCEIMLYAPRFGEERYVFWGQRGGSSYVVEITPAGQAGPTPSPPAPVLPTATWAVSPGASAYLAKALDIMEEHALTRTHIEWDTFRPKVYDQADGAHAPADTYEERE